MKILFYSILLFFCATSFAHDLTEEEIEAIIAKSHHGNICFKGSLYSAVTGKAIRSEAGNVVSFPSHDNCINSVVGRNFCFKGSLYSAVTGKAIRSESGRIISFPNQNNCIESIVGN